jgi:hypothetical protein
MTEHDSDGLFEGDGEERRELSWTEADWEKYLAEHEDSVRDYLRHYDRLAGAPDRIDEVARRLGWEMEPDDAEEVVNEAEEFDDSYETGWEPYTVHRNPVFIATKALYLSLTANWERIAVNEKSIPSTLGLGFQGALLRGREAALQAVQALDLGDYALAICFFKRALREVNNCLAQLNSPEAADDKVFSRFRDYALPRLFDLREIWLRVMAECRMAQGDE